MSQKPGEAKVQDANDVSKGLAKCRIPQRLPTLRPRPLSNKAKPNSESLRPKSASRKDDNYSRTTHPPPRSVRPERFQLKRPSTLPRKLPNDNNSQASKGGRNVITVPIGGTHKHRMHSADLPDQETIRKREDLELKGSGTFDVTQSGRAAPDHDGDTALLKSNWQQYMSQFEQMRKELGERQKAIVELYASMQTTHRKMNALGHKLLLPPPEDLKIMNVAKLSPDQLLQLCSVRQSDSKPVKGQAPPSTPLAVDVKKLYGLPTRIVATCEQTLFKRKEIIDWFVTLKSESKGISMQSLERKINEFNAENEMLTSALDQAKGDVLKEINDVVELMRVTVNQTVALQLRSEEQIHELSELTAQNKDLRKQIHNIESLKCNKGKIEELEKELKEEKCKKNMMKDRLTRAEGQIKIGVERASQLEAALEQARSQVWTLERNVQQLTKQNQKLQSDFDTELAKLTASIRENTTHLEEIAVAREKLKAEKEDLEKRLEQLSQSYNESIEGVKHDMNVNLAKLIETEKKHLVEAEEKKVLEEELEAVRAKAQEYETQNKGLTERLQDIEVQLSKAMTFEKELQSTKHTFEKELQSVKHDLELAQSDVEEYKSRLAKQGRDLDESLCMQENLNLSLRNKEQYIAELEKKQALQEKLLEESESKMSSYEEQLTALKRHITQLQDDFGEFENLEELHEMVNQQRANLLEATRQNGELAQALQNKDLELQQHLENLAEQEQQLEQREGVIKMLSEKEEEQSNIIKLLRNNLEMRTQADMDLSQQITEKNSEIEALVATLETRKQQICQLEKIILTLEEQTRKSSLQKRKDQDRINLLESQICEYEAFHSKPVDIPATKLDSIIKILEDELGTSFEPPVPTPPEYIKPRKKGMGDRRREVHHYYAENNNSQRMYHTEQESVPTKIVMGNFVKKTVSRNNDERFNVDNLGRKKAITNIGDNLDRKRTPLDAAFNMYNVPLPDKDYRQDYREPQPINIDIKEKAFLTRNIPLLNSNQFKDEKKCKMFKFAGHRL